MKRRLRIAGVLVSVLLCAGFAGLWGFSLLRRVTCYRFGGGSMLALDADSGAMGMQYTRGEAITEGQKNQEIPAAGFYLLMYKRYGAIHWLTFYAGLEDGHRSGLRERTRSAVFPTWLPAGIFAVAPVVAWRRGIRRRRARASGCCPTCGYDLRATPERCPECGTVTIPA